jgi:hypothetical protein
MGKTYKDAPAEREKRRERGRPTRTLKAYGRQPQLRHTLYNQGWDEPDEDLIRFMTTPIITGIIDQE